MKKYLDNLHKSANILLIFQFNKREEHRKMQTIGPMNSNSVLFCSVRNSRVLKSLSKNQNKLRTPSLGEVYPKIFSHNKDRFASCVHRFLQAVFLYLFGNNGYLLMLISDILPSSAVCLEKQAILHLENNYGLYKTSDYRSECF